MKKVRKGEYGYIRSQKISRLIRTLCFFALPIAFFIVGMVLNHGDRKNIYTIIAIIGCIPACLQCVNMLMMWFRKPMKEQDYKDISAMAGDLTMVYELYLTSYENNMFLDATAVCGEFVVSYTSQENRPEKIKGMQKHIKNVLELNEYPCKVKIFTNKKSFLDRLFAMREKKEEYEAIANESFVPYELYPELTRDQVVKHLLMAVSL